MDMTETDLGDVRILALNGRLDTATAPAAEARLMATLAAAPKLVVDLAGVPYVSSAGLRLLLRGHRQARATGAGFALAAPQAAVRDVLAMSGFDTALAIRPTVAEAAAALG